MVAETVSVVAAVAVVPASDGTHARPGPPLPPPTPGHTRRWPLLPPPLASTKIDPSHTRRHERRHRRVRRRCPARWAPLNKGSRIPHPPTPNTHSPLRPLRSLKPVSTPRAISVKALPPLQPCRLQCPLLPPHGAADAGYSILSIPHTAPTTDRVVSTTPRQSRTRSHCLRHSPPADVQHARHSRTRLTQRHALRSSPCRPRRTQQDIRVLRDAPPPRPPPPNRLGRPRPPHRPVLRTAL